MKEIRELLESSDSLIITAGAGMGVDSGLPDFRGNEGFWKAYPALNGKSFSSIANPETFETSPSLAWGFYGHRTDTYRNTIPHEGFKLLLEIADKLGKYFVVTSNVDEQFQSAGFDPSLIDEIHGSIFNLQCTEPYLCEFKTWRNHYQFNVDSSCHTDVIPTCKFCGKIARPNILMFNDIQQVESGVQDDNFHAWIKTVKRPLVIEIGAGTAIPSIRNFSNQYANTLIRINPRESQIPYNKGISLPMNGLDGIRLVHSYL